MISAVADRRDRHLVFVGLRRPGQQPRGRVASGSAVLPASTRPLPSSSATAYLRRHLGRHAVAQQAVDRVLAEDHAGEQRPGRSAGMCSCSRPVLSAPATRLRIHGLLQVARQAVDAFGFAGAQHVAGGAAARRWHAGRGVAGLDAAAVVDPGDGLQLGVLARPCDSARPMNSSGRSPVGDVARDAHQLLLPLEQAQAHALLGVLDVALDRLPARARFPRARKYQKADTMAARNSKTAASGASIATAVLQHRRLAAPPAAPPGQGRGVHGSCGQAATGQQEGMAECRGWPLGSGRKVQA